MVAEDPDRVASALACQFPEFQSVHWVLMAIAGGTAACCPFLARQKWAVCENTEKLVKFVAGIGDLQHHVEIAENQTLKNF